MRYIGIVSYDGTNFIGWQIQPNGRSVQEEIEKVISQILNTPTRIHGSGRTDAGVHAIAQVFHFDVESSIVDLNKFRYSVNRLLPNDIHVKAFSIVEDNFHARYDVVDKTYLYTLNMGEYDIFNRHIITQFMRPLDVNKIKECAQLFIGKHNFKNFTTKEEDKNDFERTIFEFNVDQVDEGLVFQITGSGFMRYMVRLIVGTLVEVGLGKLDKEDIEDLLTREDRSVTPYKAPPEGLFLAHVGYGDHEDA